MRNLSLLECSNISIPKSGNCDAHLAVDSDTGRIYFNTETYLVGVDPTCHEEIFSIGLEELTDHAVQVTGIHFLQGEESLCVSTLEGDLLLINVQSNMVECVGSVESGLLSISWSPDQELLLLVTGHDTIIVMTREFEPISEVSFHPKEFGEGQFVNVGWGKKETQFHGSEGKEAAKTRQEGVQNALPWDDKKPRVAWRGDGQFFGVHLIDPVAGNRIFRVWTRECTLQYTSEYVEGLESAFAWKPSGSLLASSQRRPNRHDIVFFEKNGLQHGEFTLPFGKDDMEVKLLEWNSDSSILLVWLSPLKRDGAPQESADHVLLWTVSNYHWYLKQSLPYASEETPVCVQWDGESSHKLHVICKGGRYKQYTFAKSVCHSNAPLLQQCNDGGMSYVAVIDGKSVLMTPFKIMTVPPPMCAFKLELPSQANAIMFSSLSSSSDDIAVVLKTGDVAIFSTSDPKITVPEELKLSVKLDGAGGIGFSARVKPHRPVCVLGITVDVADSIDIQALHHWVWLNTHTVFAISPGVLPATDHAVVFEIDYAKSTLTAKKSCTVDGVILTVTVISDDCVVLQRQDGHLLKCQVSDLSITDYVLPNGVEVSLPRQCLQVAYCTFKGVGCIVGLSEHSRMYINDTEIASDCSSFCVHSDFLFLTTHSHQLRCISRNVNLQDVLRYYSTPAEGRSLLENCAVIENHRVLERGSKIVTVTPFDSRLILQMPRGNLELIHPRCLVLSLVNRLIKGLEYGKAFTVMKKHRINMNLLYDIDQRLFEANVAKFIEELGSTANINIFICDLQNEDLTGTMYRQYFFFTTSTSDPNLDGISSKINFVCDALIAEMAKNEKRFMMSLVTAHVRKQPSEVGLALKRIKTFADSVGLDCKTISDTLKYMTVLVDSNALFNEALGTYDFKLVLMVAEKSQLDPKEYLPMLKDLQEFGDNYRKYKIDAKLRRYPSALKHISRCDDHFDECIELIRDHELYEEALKLFEEGSKKYSTICKSYAKYLESQNKHEKAGNMFLRCGELQRALDSYSSSSNYFVTMSVAYKMKLQPEEISRRARKIADRAKSRGDYRDAVDILEYHARDIEGALEAALHGHMWARAVCISEKYAKIELIENQIRPAIAEAYNQTCQVLEFNKETIVKHCKRLQAVRQLKERQRMQALFDGVEGLDSDMYSDTSSTMAGSVSSRASSTSTRNTGRTSKSRRKREKKLYSLKEGSKFEDVALLHALKSAIVAVDNMSGEVADLASHLRLLRFDDFSAGLLSLHRDVRALIAQLLPTIWCDTMLTHDQRATGPESTANSIVAAMQSKPSAVEDSNPMFSDLSIFIPPKFDA